MAYPYDDRAETEDEQTARIRARREFLASQSPGMTDEQAIRAAAGQQFKSDALPNEDAAAINRARAAVGDGARTSSGEEPPPAAAGPPPGTPQPGQLTRTSSSTSTTRTILGKDEEKIAADRAKNTEDRAGIQKEIGEAQAKGEEIKGEEAARRAAVRGEFGKQEAAMDAAQEAERRQKLAELKQIDDEIANTKIESLWAKQSTGRRIGLIVAAAFGAIGSALRGGKGNAALDVINQTIDQDLAIQKANLEKKERSRTSKREGIADFERSADRVRARLALVKANALDGVADEFEATAAKQKAEEKRQLGLDNAAKARDAALAIRQELAQATRRTSTHTENKVAADPGFGSPFGAAGGKITGEQATAEAAVRTMIDAYQTISGGAPLSPKALEAFKQAGMLQKIAAKRPELELGLRKVGALKDPIASLPAAEQKTVYAWQALHESVLRALTGAGATAEEAERTASRILPQPGDAPETVKHKMTQARQFIEAQAARAAPQRQQALTQGLSQPAPASGGGGGGLPPGAIPGTYQGRKGYRLGSKFYPTE